MSISVIGGCELSESHIGRWREIQSMHPYYTSPYFCPEFTLSVASVRRDVYIAILKEKNETIGFFPFQNRYGFGCPVGSYMNDLHGLIIKPDVHFDFNEVLHATRLASWDFHHLVDYNFYSDRYILKSDISHYMDLSEGFNGYIKDIKDRGSGIFKEYKKKIRMIEREVGPLRFIPNSSDSNILNKLINWKSRQYRITGLVDIFKQTWTCNLLEKILDCKGDSFAGMLSVLMAGNNILAIHMGMRSNLACNLWFLRHNLEYSRYSPGMVLRMLIAEHASSLNMLRVDVGCGGSETHKPRICTGGIPVAFGSVEIRTPLTIGRKLLQNVADYARKSALRPIYNAPAKLLADKLRRMNYR